MPRTDTLVLIGVAAAAMGCASAFDLWSIDDGLLLVSAQEPWSLIACSRDQDDQDHWFARFLDSRPAIAVAADGITLTSGDTQIPFALVPSD